MTCACSSTVYYHRFLGRGTTFTSNSSCLLFFVKIRHRAEIPLSLWKFPLFHYNSHLYDTFRCLLYSVISPMSFAQVQRKGEFLNTRVLSPYETVHRPKLVWFDVFYSSIYELNHRYSRLTKLQSKVRPE